MYLFGMLLLRNSCSELLGIRTLSFARYFKKLEYTTLCCLIFRNTKRWTKSKNPVVLSVIHHRPEPFRIFLLLFIKFAGYKVLWRTSGIIRTFLTYSGREFSFFCGIPCRIFSPATSAEVEKRGSIHPLLHTPSCN